MLLKTYAVWAFINILSIPDETGTKAPTPTEKYDKGYFSETTVGGTATYLQWIRFD